MYCCNWTIELPVIVNDMVVGYATDLDCIMALDEVGDLFKLGFKACTGIDTTYVMSGPLFEAGLEELDKHRMTIMELAGIPSDVRYPPRERPEYTGREYHPLTF